NALGEQGFFDIEDSPHLLVLGSSGSGKPQPLTARIPVPISERFPDGWALLGDLVPGDQVFDGADGSVRTIESLSEDIEDEVFVVTTSDGQKHEASSRHLWEVRPFEDRQSLAHFAARRPAAPSTRARTAPSRSACARSRHGPPMGPSARSRRSPTSPMSRWSASTPPASSSAPPRSAPG